MKKFMDQDFMLQSETAKKLFFNYAKDMPIYDYHCHLSPKEIWENKTYENLTQAWLYGDHYKWRAMRANGMDEEYVTGQKSDYLKFLSYAKTIEKCIGNPLYHWTHLELQRYFGIEEVLSEKTANDIYEKANLKLSGGKFGARDMIEQSNVKIICTTDDPVDSLEYHQKIAKEGKLSARVLPAFRPDKILNPTKEYIEKLSQVSGVEITDLKTLQTAAQKRIDFFHENGCRLSDHAFNAVPYGACEKDQANEICKALLLGKVVSKEDLEKYQTYMMLFFAKEYTKRGWGMQLHIATIRNNNSKMFEKLGPDTGFDSINDQNIAEPLSRLLDAMNKEESLPKTILYTLNPKDNYVLASMIGNFQEGRIPGKMQFGSGWWFNDQRDGMEEQMKALSNIGMLSLFVGMLTDSRSFLSYTRHEYFRRILCNLIGKWVEDGEFPCDMELLGKIVCDISYNNAEKYFNM